MLTGCSGDDGDGAFTVAYIEPDLTTVPLMAAVEATREAGFEVETVELAEPELAVANVPASLVEMGRCFGANEWQLVTRVVLPAATPTIMAGARLGMGRAVLGMINGEMFIAVVGLGRIVTQAGGRFDGARVLAVLLVIIVVAISAVGLVQLADRRLTSWLPKTVRTNQ